MIDVFLDILGNPDDMNSLKEYDLFIESCKEKEINDDIYTEMHHIVPKCTKYEFVESCDNLIRLKYDDHKMAHELLARAYEIPMFLIPMNFFNNYEKDDDFSEILSKIRKIEWVEFKKTEKYQLWINHRRESTNNFNNFLEAGTLSSRNRNNDSEYRKYIKDKVLEFWNNADDVYRKRHSELIVDGIHENGGVAKIRQSVINRWNDEAYVVKMKEKMKEVNNRIDKKINAGKKVKDNWKDPIYIENVRVGRLNGKKRDSEAQADKIKKLWADPIWKENTLKTRKEKRNERMKNEA